MKKPKAPRLVTVAVLTTVTIIFWIFYGVYITLTHRPQVDVPSELLKNISPVLDTTTLDKLPDKTFFVESDVLDFVAPTSAAKESVRSAATENSVDTTKEKNNQPSISPTQQ